MSTRTIALALALAALASCQIVRGPGVALSTSPPGARVLIDGRDSGFLTPCMLDIGRDDHRIDFELDGYQPATRMVGSGGRVYLIQWEEAFLNYQVWRFPLWLNYVDGLAPLKIDRGNSPARIFVRLRRGAHG